MKRHTAFLRILALGCVLSCSSGLLDTATAQQAAMPSVTSDVPRTIAYQGVLTDHLGAPIKDGAHTITVTLYPGATVTEALWKETYVVRTQDGIFNLQLGSGPTPLPSAEMMNRALFVGLSVDGTAEMGQRTALSAMPYALNVADNSISTAKLTDNAVTAEKMGTDFIGAISVNGERVSSKGGTINFVGNEELSVRYDAATSSVYLTPNKVSDFIGGNPAANNSDDGTLAGGNPLSTNTVGGGVNNLAYPATGPFPITTGWTTIGGGRQNVASSNYAAVTGGWQNTSSGTESYVGGGLLNTSSGSDAAIGGGHNNAASGNTSTVAGGNNDLASGTESFIGGGNTNTASGGQSVVAGGFNNTASSNSAVVSGGENNEAAGTASAIAGGRYLKVGNNSFGFSGNSGSFTAGTAVDVSGATQTAYLGDVDLWLGNYASGGGTPRSLRFYQSNATLNYTGIGTGKYSAFQAAPASYGTQTNDIIYQLPVTIPTGASNFLHINSASTVGTLTTVKLDWAAGGGGGGVTGTGVATRVAFWDAATNLNSNANLYWDNVNNRLGVGTGTPATTLDVVGAASVSGNATIGGNATVNGNASVTGTATVTSTFTANGNSNLGNGNDNVIMNVGTGNITVTKTGWGAGAVQSTAGGVLSSGVLTATNGGTGTSATPTAGSILVGTGSAYAVKSLLGTANRVTVTVNPGNITLSGPQDVATSSSPTFANLSLTGGLSLPSLAPNSPVRTDGASSLTTGAIDLSSGAEVVNVLGLTNGGTGLSGTAYGPQDMLVGDPGGTGALVQSTLTAGVGINITPGPGTITIDATGSLPTINGTPNQINVVTAGSTYTLSTPQDIATTSDVTFNTVTATAALGAVAAPNLGKTYQDNTIYSWGSIPAGPGPVVPFSQFGITSATWAGNVCTITISGPSWLTAANSDVTATIIDDPYQPTLGSSGPGLISVSQVQKIAGVNNTFEVRTYRVMPIALQTPSCCAPGTFLPTTPMPGMPAPIGFLPVACAFSFKVLGR